MKKVLMISTDQQAFASDSAVCQRLVDLGELVDKLDVIVFSLQKKGFAQTKISEQVTLYPTNSYFYLAHIFSALLIGYRLLKVENRLITCQDPFFTGLAGLILAKKFKTKLELQLHTDVLSPAFRRFNFKNRIYYWLAKVIIPQADQVRVVSDRLEASLFKAELASLDKIYVLPIFIETVKPIQPAWQSLLPAGAKAILTVGRLEAEKRLPLAFEALRLLADKNIFLVVIGSGGKLSSLKNLATRLNLADQVIFAGRLTPAELAGSYQLAQVLLHTSAYEGYGLVLAEAAQMGLPVVSTDVGIAREVGAIITSGQPQDIANAILKTIKSGRATPPANLPTVTKEEYLARLTKAWQ